MEFLRWKRCILALLCAFWSCCSTSKYIDDSLFCWPETSKLFKESWSLEMPLRIAPRMLLLTENIQRKLTSFNQWIQLIIKVSKEAHDDDDDQADLCLKCSRKLFFSSYQNRSVRRRRMYRLSAVKAILPRSVSITLPKTKHGTIFFSKRRQRIF